MCVCVCFGCDVCVSFTFFFFSEWVRVYKKNDFLPWFLVLFISISVFMQHSCATILPLIVPPARVSWPVLFTVEPHTQIIYWFICWFSRFIYVRARTLKNRIVLFEIKHALLSLARWKSNNGMSRCMLLIRRVVPPAHGITLIRPMVQVREGKS